MALPPTAFKDLLYGSYDEVYDTLRKKRCLSWRGRRNREAVLEVMRKSRGGFAAWAQEHPGMTGPNAHDWLNDALLASPYVNKRARRLARKDTRWD